MNKEYIRIVAVMLIVSVTVALMLAGVHELTKPAIESRTRQRTSDSLTQVFENGFVIADDPFETEGAVITPMFKADTRGYAIELSTPGYAGVINLLVGVVVGDEDIYISGVAIIKHSETAEYFNSPGYGEYLGMFAGATDNEMVVDTVTAATVTSQAIINGVTAALELAAAVEEGS